MQSARGQWSSVISRARIAKPRFIRLLTARLLPSGDCSLPDGQWIAAFNTTSRLTRSSRTSLQRPSFCFSMSSCSLSGHCCAIPCRAKDACDPACAKSKDPRPNLTKRAAELSRLQQHYALHYAETRQIILLPFLIVPIANIARKRPDPSWGETSSNSWRMWNGPAPDPSDQNGGTSDKARFRCTFSQGRRSDRMPRQ